MDISFHLNGAPVTAQNITPTTTVLDWLRETRGLRGTKEGCNEGDCGACSVMLTDAKGAKALNACILFVPQISGKHLTTVEGLCAPDGTLHPAQQALIDHHASQCGFCTPGFAISLATAQMNGATDYDTQLAGNLCRCTGYAPIIRAAQAMARAPSPIIFFIFPEKLRGSSQRLRGLAPKTPLSSRKTRMSWQGGMSKTPMQPSSLGQQT